MSATSYTIGTAYDPFTYGAGNPLKNTAPLVLSTNCTLNDPISWTVGIGNNCNKATASDRAMTDGSLHYLGYQLYTTNGFGTQYGTNTCGTPTATSQSGGGTGTPNTISLYGEVPGGQNAFVSGSGPTAYTDTITVTLSY